MIIPRLVELPRKEHLEYPMKKKVISLLIEDSSYTSNELAAKMGVKKNIKYIFVSLKNKKVIERTGSKCESSWIVIK